jgi:hypothetical protein
MPRGEQSSVRANWKSDRANNVRRQHWKAWAIRALNTPLAPGGTPISVCPQQLKKGARPRRFFSLADSCASAPNASELRSHLRHQREQTADDAVIGHADDRRSLVLVNRHDHLRVLHAGQVLDRVRDADCDVELRGDDLAGLAQLVVVRPEARIHRCARSAQRSVSCAYGTPTDTAITSVATPASCRRTASSTAISTPMPSDLTRTLTL